MRSIVRNEHRRTKSKNNDLSAKGDKGKGLSGHRVLDVEDSDGRP